jgi:hypothetical protein
VLDKSRKAKYRQISFGKKARYNQMQVMQSKSVRTTDKTGEHGPNVQSETEESRQRKVIC